MSKATMREESTIDYNEYTKLRRQLSEAQGQLERIGNFTANAKNINSLPEKIRRYIMLLETRADPTGDLQTIASLTDQRDGALASMDILEGKLAEAQGQLEIERMKVEIALNTLTECDCVPDKDYHDCDDEKTNCPKCWQNYLDLEAARRVKVMK